MTKMKKVDNKKVGEDDEQLQYLIFLAGAHNGTATLENSLIACNKVIYIYTYIHIHIHIYDLAIPNQNTYSRDLVYMSIK